MRDTALFPAAACSQRLQSSRKRAETERGETGREADMKEVEGDKIDSRGEGEGYRPLSRDVC